MIAQLELEGLRRDWIEDAIASWPFVVRALPPEWTVDDLHNHFRPPEHHNWYGILCAALKGRGWITRTGYRPSTRPEANGRVVAVWRGRV